MKIYQDVIAKGQTYEGTSMNKVNLSSSFKQTRFYYGCFEGNNLITALNLLVRGQIYITNAQIYALII